MRGLTQRTTRKRAALIGRIIVWLVGGVTFFLSLWIVLPAPNLFFLRLAVGAPEISPLLGLIGLATLGITLGLKLWRYKPPRLLTAMLLAALLLSSWPLLGLPNTVARADASMSAAFASPSQAASYPPFSWRNFFRGIPSGEVRYQANIPFASPDGVSLSLDLYQPATPGKYPAVVTIYGGSWARGNPAESADLSRFLAARGYVVAAIDYRHAPAYRFPAQLEDVQTALAFVRDRAD
ncbi:hypothetical protein BH23CYA1_BH23CYA1_10760 [soil metagenome]